jgi:hypothetical protein
VIFASVVKSDEMKELVEVLLVVVKLVTVDEAKTGVSVSV